MKIEFALFKIIYGQCRNSQPPILIYQIFGPKFNRDLN
ncbi:hypothetical protein J2X97_001399 [Epilithonimonas hungarica]|nr:hypothetical protein [Epilithonimonas hungarica]